jgi:hypothetical protein
VCAPRPERLRRCTHVDPRWVSAIVRGGVIPSCEMPERVQDSNSQPPDSRLVAFARGWRLVPSNVRALVLGVALLVAGLAAYAFSPVRTSHLNVVVRHNLEGAELSVLVDGEPSFSSTIPGSRAKRFGLFGKRADRTFSKSLVLGAGAHTVQVRVQSADDGFDQTAQERVVLSGGEVTTLSVSASTEQAGLSLVVPAAAAQPGVATGVLGAIQSVFVTVLGFIASATIGFLVQESLRSRKMWWLSPPPADRRGE